MAKGDTAQRAKDRLKERRGAMYRGVILDAAERVFAEEGYESAKMQRVATEAGVSSSTVYTAFQGKWDLFRAVHERRGRELMDRVRRAPSARGEPFARLLGGVAAYALHLMEHPDYLRMLGHAKVWTAGDKLPSEEQSSTALQGESLVMRTFADGIEVGVFRDDRPEMMTRLMHSTQQVRLLDWLERGMPDAPEEVVRDLQREVVRMFVPHDDIPRRLSEIG